MRQFCQWEASLSLHGPIAMARRNAMGRVCMALATKKCISQDKYNYSEIESSRHQRMASKQESFTTSCKVPHIFLLSSCFSASSLLSCITCCWNKNTCLLALHNYDKYKYRDDQAWKNSGLSGFEPWPLQDLWGTLINWAGKPTGSWLLNCVTINPGKMKKEWWIT